MAVKCRFDDADQAPAADESTLLYRFGIYQRAADELLRELDFYNRQSDPLILFAEHLVASHLDGCLASSSNQEGWDLRWGSGRRVQVRTLRNESQNNWKNGIDIVFGKDVDDFVGVFFFGRKPSWYLLVPKEAYTWLRVELGAHNKRW